MPHASELEEFGLEVERENHALITPTRTISSNGLHLQTPSKEQRALLQSANTRNTRVGTSVLKWAALILLLAIVVFHHLSQESEETSYVETEFIEAGEIEICQDNPEFSLMFKNQPQTCATFVERVGSIPQQRQKNGGFLSGLLESRCNHKIGIPDEHEFQQLLKHFCRKSCGLCGTDDVEEGVSEQVLKAEINEIAEEIEEKEIEEEMEEELEEEKAIEEMEKDLEEQEKELAEDAAAEDDDTNDVPKADANTSAANHEKEQQQNTDQGDEDENTDESDHGEKNKVSDSSAVVGEKDQQDTSIGNAATVSDQGEDQVSASSQGMDEKEQQSINAEASNADGAENIEGEGSALINKQQHQSTDDVADNTVGQQEGDASDKPTVEQSNVSINAGEGNGVMGEQKAPSDTDNEESGEEEKPSSSASLGESGSFTLQRLQATRTAATNLITLLEEYYNGAEQTKRMLLDAWQSQWNFDNPEGTARDRVDKLVDTMARALVTDDQTEFIIGTIGSSVAAGHDNCHYDSYESQLERTFAPVWEAAGMKLVAQNAGEGGGCGDDFNNQVFCIKQNVSPNIDIAHYTWTYFEHGEEKFTARENLIRWTQMLPHQPPVHVFNAGLNDHDDKDQEEGLVEYYSKYGYNQFYIKQGHTNGGYDYQSDSSKGIDHYAWGFIGDGYHSTTRYGVNEPSPDRKESLGVVFRNWHPGPLAFEFLSDAFAYTYSKAILEALDMIESAITSGKDPRKTWSASKRKILLKKSLPEPKYCEPRYCVVDEAPGCLNYELPTYGNWGARVEDANDNLNPHQGALQNWEMWYEPTDFWHMVGKQDTAIFQDREDKEICKHLDQCAGISATSSENGMVVFRLPKMEVGLVVICMCCGKDVAEEQILSNPFIEIKYNNAVLDRTQWDKWPNNKCVRLLDKFPTQGQAAMTPTGHAYLSINTLDGLSKPVKISHVITL